MEEQSSFIKRIKQIFYASTKSLQYLLTHKKLLFFPVFTFSLIILFASCIDTVNYKTFGSHIFLPTKKTESQSEKSIPHKARRRGIPFEILLLMLISIIASYFSNVALSFALTPVFKGEKARIMQSILYILLQTFTIVCTAFLILFVGIFSKIFSRKDEAEDAPKRNWFQKKFNMSGDFGWSIATFLVVPIIAHEKHTIINNIKRSSELIEATFGHNFKNYVSVNVVTDLCIAGLAIIAALIFGIALIINQIFHNPIIIDIGGYIVISIIVLSCIIGCFLSSATTVFKTAAYHYATGNLIGPFSEHEIREVIVEEKK